MDGIGGIAKFYYGLIGFGWMLSWGLEIWLYINLTCDFSLSLPNPFAIISVLNISAEGIKLLIFVSLF